MRTISNLSPYLANATPNGPVSFVPTRGDVADCLKELLELALGTGPDGRLMEDARSVLVKRCYEDEIRWALRLCRDTRNAQEVAGELAWAGTRTIEHVITVLDRLRFLCR